ncbi:MAG: hypothetical protein KJP12_02525 [Acidimicrobiia bacterium]|nr:hypothetical protein [Acidimicrobiia bacterium]
MTVSTHLSRVSLFGDPSQLSIGEPFDVAHGWDLATIKGPAELFTFRLEVEGRDVGDGDLLETTDDGLVHRLFHFKFTGWPRGVFTLTGRWLAPCCDAVDLGYPGPCPIAHQPIEVWVEQHTVIVGA